MVHFTEVDGVIFTESMLPAQAIQEIVLKAATQNTTLIEMKQQVAVMVRNLGGNGLINFKYGQVADKGKSLFNPFKWDTERITVTGTAVILAEKPSAES
jgi:hypothetical protein